MELKNCINNFNFYLIMATAVFSLTVGPIILYKYLEDPNAGVPAYDNLVTIKGDIDWVESYDHGVRFGLTGYSMSFDYHSKAGAIEQVNNALLLHQEKEAEVLVELKDAHSPMDSATVDLHVFQLAIDGIMIRTHEQTSTAWLADNRLMLYVGIFFTLGGLILAYHSIFKKN